jgi:hypothetical protein
MQVNEIRTETRVNRLLEDLGGSLTRLLEPKAASESYLGELFRIYRERLKDVLIVAEELQKFGFSLPWVNAPNVKMRLEIRSGAVGTDRN